MKLPRFIVLILTAAGFLVSTTVAATDEEIIASMTWGDVTNGAQMGIRLPNIQVMREKWHDGTIPSLDSNSVRLNIMIKNMGPAFLRLYAEGAYFGLYTLDEQGQRVDLHLSDDAGATGIRGSISIAPGETDNEQYGLMLNLFAKAKNGIYVTVNMADANGNNPFELVSARIDNDELARLFAPLDWGPVTDGAQVAIEIRHVDDPIYDYRDVPILPFNIYVRAVGDSPVQRSEPDFSDNAIFVTQDEQGNSKDMNVASDGGVLASNGKTFETKPGTIERMNFSMPIDLLKDIHGTLSVRVPLTIDGKRIQAQSAPVDARLINDFINTIADENPKLTPIPEANLNPLPAASGSTAPIRTAGANSTSPAPKPAAKPTPPIAQAESPSYTVPVLLALGALIVVGFFLRRRK